jgi:phosphodiesterase/alkaline phosphatase D-like protein
LEEITAHQLSRRRLLIGAGGFVAASVVAPQAAALNGGRRAPTLRGGSFPEGVLSGDPSPNGITLWTRLGGVGEAEGASSWRSRATAASAGSSPAS